MVYDEILQQNLISLYNKYIGVAENPSIFQYSWSG